MAEADNKDDQVEEGAAFEAGPLKIKLMGKAVGKLGPLILVVIIVVALVVGYWGMYLTPQEILKNTAATKAAVEKQGVAIGKIETYLARTSRGRYQTTELSAAMPAAQRN